MTKGLKVKCIIAHNGYNIGDEEIATETMCMYFEQYWTLK